jgi:CheY-like chemotaxis protein
MIDDDIPFSITTQILLTEAAGYDVRIENDSSAAIETAREFRPDLILLDIVMPGFDGGDIRLMLRDDPELADIPVLIISALLTKDDTGSATFVECRDQIIFSKPISSEKLIDEIEKNLVPKVSPG